jgi:glutathione S-transferase
MATQEGLALYQFMSCPSCAYVRSAASGLGVELELLDIHSQPQHAADLRAATGRTTVPVLKITEPGGNVRLLPESADIVEYLRELAG